MNTPINDGGPAFPTESAAQTGNTTWRYEGMTLRDKFADSALKGICASAPGNHMTNDMIALEAYSLADSMIKARSA